MGLPPPLQLFCDQEVTNGSEKKKINNKIEGKGMLRTTLPPSPISIFMTLIVFYVPAKNKLVVVVMHTLLR